MTYRLLRIDAKGRAEARDRETFAHARLVSAWVTRTPLPNDRLREYVVAHVRNNSNEPVYDVAFRLSGESEDRQFGDVPPGETDRPITIRTRLEEKPRIDVRNRT